MLILSFWELLRMKQVNYIMAAFVLHRTQTMPDWDTLTEEECVKRDMYFALPRGFSLPGKVTSPKLLSLYGLKQAPQNIFLHLDG
jgi:hypothetical protein